METKKTLIVYVFSDGCVFTGDDSLLVSWLSSTSKPGTFLLYLFLIILPDSQYLRSTNLAVFHFFSASADEFWAGGFAPEHVRGCGDEEDWSAVGAGDLWASPQNLNAASCWAARQTAGRRRLQKLSKWCLTRFSSALSALAFLMISIKSMLVPLN